MDILEQLYLYGSDGHTVVNEITSRIRLPNSYQYTLYDHLIELVRRRGALHDVLKLCNHSEHPNCKKDAAYVEQKILENEKAIDEVSLLAQQNLPKFLIGGQYFAIGHQSIEHLSLCPILPIEWPLLTIDFECSSAQGKNKTYHAIRFIEAQMIDDLQNDEQIAWKAIVETRKNKLSQTQPTKIVSVRNETDHGIDKPIMPRTNGYAERDEIAISLVEKNQVTLSMRPHEIKAALQAESTLFLSGYDDWWRNNPIFPKGKPGRNPKK